MLVVQRVKQLWHCTLEVISHTSRSTPCFPCCGSCPFDFSLNGLNAWSFSKSAFDASRFGCVSNWWIMFLTASLRVSSCCWTVECGNPWFLKSMLPQRISPYSLPLRVSLCSLLRWSTDALASKLVCPAKMQIRLQTILCGNSGDWYILLYNLLLTSCYHLLDAHHGYVLKERLGWIVFVELQPFSLSNPQITRKNCILESFQLYLCTVILGFVRSYSTSVCW